MLFKVFFQSSQLSTNLVNPLFKRWFCIAKIAACSAVKVISPLASLEALRNSFAWISKDSALKPYLSAASPIIIAAFSSCSAASIAAVSPLIKALLNFSISSAQLSY